MSTMTLEQVRDWHLARDREQRAVGYFIGATDHAGMAAAIDAHLLSQDAETERLREAMEPKLRELHYDANGLRATLDGGACKALAESFAEQFNSSGAVNYLDVEFTTADGTSFVVTVRKRAKPTAHELRRLAESRLAAANALLRFVRTRFDACMDDSDRASIDAHLSENTHDRA